MKLNIRRYIGLAIPFVCLVLACSSMNASGQSEKDQDGFVPLFDGKSLSGWEGDAAYWRMENGLLIGETNANTPALENNTFLIWKDQEPGDFELITEFRISSAGNSGINYRSERVEGLPFALKGYQADIDGMNQYTGQNYEERGRTTLAYRGQKVTIPASGDGKSEGNAWSAMQVIDSLGSPELLKEAIRVEEWNECRLVVKGNRLQHYINGVLMSDITDDDSRNRKMKGLIGFQIHTGPPMKVEYRNARIRMK